MVVKTGKGINITLEKHCFSSGGEGDVYKIISPSSYNAYCAKILKDQYKTPQREQKLKFMISNSPKEIVGQSVILAWPIDVIYSTNGGFLGFIMPLAYKNSVDLTRLTLFNLDPKLLSTSKDWGKFDRGQTQKYNVYENRLKLIFNIAYAIYLLHSTHKYVLKDFKPPNVLVTSDGKITMVDMDSIQMCENGQLRYPADVLTPDYTPPECYSHNVGMHKNVPLSSSWDCFSFSVVFYEILFGIHPFQVVPMSDSDGCNVPEKIKNNLFVFGRNQNRIKRYAPLHNSFNFLPYKMQELFVRAFDRTASERPSCKEWLKILAEILHVSPQTSSSGSGTSSQQNQVRVYLKRADKLKETSSYLVDKSGVYVGFVNIPAASSFVLNTAKGVLGPFNCPANQGCYFCFYAPSGPNVKMNGIYILDNLRIDEGSMSFPMRYNTKTSSWFAQFESNRDNYKVEINGQLHFYPFNATITKQIILNAGFTINSGNTMTFNFCQKGNGMLIPKRGRYRIYLNTKHTDNLTYTLKRL